MATTVPSTTPVRRTAGSFPFAVYPCRPAPAPRTLLDVLEATAAAFPRSPAIDDGAHVLTYSALLDQLRGFCSLIAANGVGHGDRVGIRVSSGTADLYVVDPRGAGRRRCLRARRRRRSRRARRARCSAEAGVGAVIGRAGDRPACRVAPAERARGGRGRRDDAWIIFTSGSTGKPKGVAVTHRSAAAFVDAEARLFLQARGRSGPGDRVLAGLSVAFDASCEEMWLAWRHGACLVPAPRSLVQAAPTSAPGWSSSGISVVSTVPTLAGAVARRAAARHPAADPRRRGVPGRARAPAGADLPRGLEHLRPHRDHRRRLRRPDWPATSRCASGCRSTGWHLAVVDPEHRRARGAAATIGELVIGGVGTARYLDPEKDAAKFRPLPALGWDRAYRSGDLVRADPEGLSFIGRADTQVKIRGYRIELSEIEAVLLYLPGVAQAVVTTYEPRPGLVELVAYVSPSARGRPWTSEAIHRGCAARLPAHMVPAYVEELAVIPTMTSGKADRKELPPPRRRRRRRPPRPTSPLRPAPRPSSPKRWPPISTWTRSRWRATSSTTSAPTRSMLAQFCARVRQRPELPPVAIKDVYLTTRRSEGSPRRWWHDAARADRRFDADAAHAGTRRTAPTSCAERRSSLLLLGAIDRRRGRCSTRGCGGSGPPPACSTAFLRISGHAWPRRSSGSASCRSLAKWAADRALEAA